MGFSFFSALSFAFRLHSAGKPSVKNITKTVPVSPLFVGFWLVGKPGLFALLNGNLTSTCSFLPLSLSTFSLLFFFSL